MKNRLIQEIETKQQEKIRGQRVDLYVEQLKAQKKKEPSDEEKQSLIPNIEIGDLVDVYQRILEGSKERTQVFSGYVIAIKHGGIQTTFTVRKIVQGEGVERVFPLNSPKIAKIEVKRHSRVRRAKLFYLRDRVGKATRLKERLPKAVIAEMAKKKKKSRRTTPRRKTSADGNE